MSFRTYLIVMTLATVAAWLSWLVVLVSIDPARAGQVGFIFFYLTLATALVGSLSIGGAGVRIWLKRDIPVSRHVAKSFRHGLLLTCLLVGALLMLGFGLFRWWTITLLVCFVTLMETAFLTLQRNKRY
ncbi:hypothetical protein KJ611_01580 [Patescibacteria group bacterium]|nr:hypothetical protein [Patescibacteria group bacterium]MBU1705337.1 hypothetical protein [Patescibacteria group bacterium]